MKPRGLEWVSKQEAAQLLGVAVRQVERREAQGYLEKRKRPRQPGESTARSEYSRADIDALKAGKPNVHAVAVTANQTLGYADAIRDMGQQQRDELAAAPSNALALRPAPEWKDPFGGLAAHLARLATAFPSQAVALKPWLTLEEAVEASGLPAAHLLREAQSGALVALNVGTPARPKFRYNRELLGAGKAAAHA